MTLTKAFLTVLLSMALGGVIGGGIGYAVGRFFPDALRVQFRHAAQPEVDPVQVGTGIGIPQGVMLGAVVGLGITAVMAWHDARVRRQTGAGAS